MKKILLSMLALLCMAVTGAWADGKVYTSAVDITALQVGDILAEGASINGSGSIIFDLNRVKVNGTLQTEGFIYLYTSDFDSFGAEGVISLSNNSTISPVDKDNNDGNAWEVTNVENNNYIHIQGITYAPATDDTTVFELSGTTATTGTLTLGTAGVEATTVKIHTNTDNVAGIKLSSSYNLADGKYFTIAPATGSFKAGDKLSIAVCFNNTDDTKNAKAAIYAADGATLLYTTANGINGRNSADDPAVEEYVLTQDADLLYIGRNGNTATFVTTLKVVRPASSGGGSGQEITGDAYALSVGENAQGSVKFLVGENEVTTAKEGETVTVVITPNTGWVVNKPSGQWIAAEAAARSAVPMLNGFELTKLLGADNSWSFTMERANAEVSVSYKKLLTNSDITIEDITALTYTGQALEPAVTVKDGSTVLTKDVDYTVAYSNNTNAALATATENAPTVIITAVATSEKYAGDTIKTFTINKADITPTAPVAKTGLVYTAEAQELITAGSIVGAGNMEACQMQYSLDGQTYATTIPTGTDAKEYTVYYKVEGDANHNDVAAQNFKVTIVPDTLTEVSLVDTLFMYNFKTPVEQTAEIKEVKTKTLTVPAAQYDIQGNKGTEPGQYTVTVTGKTNFTGSVSTTFTIKDTEIPGTAEETETGKEVNDVKVVLSVVDRTQQTLNIDNIIEATASGKDIIIDIPATVNGWTVTSISPNALAGLNNVTDIFMPETGETPIQVTDAALQAGNGKATVHAPIQLLDNYANLLPGHVSDKKVVSEVMQTAKRFWTFSCGVDVELPAGVTANIVKANNDTQVISEPISGNTVKANNGVLLEGDQGVEYTLTAKAATGVGNDYAGNLLEPVVENKHHAYGQGYYILNGGMFYAIANDATAVGSCKAVLHIAGANARVINLIDEATGISVVSGSPANIGTIYDLNGRKLDGMPIKKGIYVKNGRKVVVK